MALAVLGLAVSLMVHLAAWSGIDLPFEAFGLHFGVFVVWLPAALVPNWMARHYPRMGFWKGALRGCPTWMRWMTAGLFAYALLNFISAFIGPANSSPSGTAPVLRAFSGHWMAFYATAFAIFYSATHAEHSGQVRHCPLGHAVAPTAKYCDQCGMLVSPQVKHVWR
jgi:hypothetical protein